MFKKLMNKYYVNKYNKYMDKKYNFNVELLDDIVTILSINKKNSKKYLQELLELTLMNKNKSNFFTITNSENELSIICSWELFDKIKTDFDDYDYNRFHNKYNIYQFHEGGTGLEHTGIVEKLSNIFSTKHIPIIYINSFNNNFILIEEKYKHKSIEILKNLKIMF